MVETRVKIAAASHLSGVSKDNIRSWEKRYNAIAPIRTPKGGRLYTNADIYRLKLLKHLVGSGLSISRVATLPLDELETLEGSHSKTAETTMAHGEIHFLLDCIRQYDPVKAEVRMNRLAALLSPDQFVLEIVVPLMERVGSEWEAGTLRICQEHMASAVIRSTLGTLLRLHFRENPPFRLVFTTLEGELHEFGIMVAAMLAQARGIGVIYLGPNLPAEEIVAVLRETKAHGVVLGSAFLEQEAQVARLLTLRSEMDPEQKVIIGGRSSTLKNPLLKRDDLIFVPTVQSFLSHITSW